MKPGKPTAAQLEALRLAPLRCGESGAHPLDSWREKPIAVGTVAACVRRGWLSYSTYEAGNGAVGEWHITDAGRAALKESTDG